MKGYKNNHSKTIASSKQQSSPKKKTVQVKSQKQETKIKKETPSLSNHDRIIAQRAKKLNMTVELYQMLYPKGFEVN